MISCNACADLMTYKCNCYFICAAMSILIFQTVFGLSVCCAINFIIASVEMLADIATFILVLLPNKSHVSTIIITFSLDVI